MVNADNKDNENNEPNESESRIDLIKNNPKKAVRKLSWPMMLMMILFIGYNIVDSIWIAGLGINALAALGFITPIYTVVVGLGQGIGAGTTSLLARCIGAEDKDKTSNGGIHSLLITLIASIIVPIIFILFLKDILILMGASSVLDMAMEYGVIIFLGSFAILFSLVGSSILRAEGDMKKVTYAMLITSVLNMIIDPIFIYTLHMGIAGAAIATVISSSISGIVIFYWILVSKNNYIKLKFNEFKMDIGIFKDILVVSLPASLEEFMMALSAIGTNTILAYVAGATAVAVYTVGWRIVTLGLIPAIGVETATLTIAGVAYGARNFKNLEITCNYAIKLGVAIGAVLSVLTFVFAPQIVLLFSYSSGTENLASGLVLFLRILSIFFVAIPFGLVSTAVFQAAGKGFTSLILNFIRDIGLSLVIAYILGVLLNFGEIGVYIGIVSGVIIGSIFNYLYFRVFLGKLKNKYGESKEDITPINT